MQARQAVVQTAAPAAPAAAPAPALQPARRSRRALWAARPCQRVTASALAAAPAALLKALTAETATGEQPYGHRLEGNSLRRCSGVFSNREGYRLQE